MKTIEINQQKIPLLGQGAWNIGDKLATKQDEIKAIRFGIDMGMTLIDTAEMYGDGKSELLIGEAIKNVERKNLYLVSKVLPSNVVERKTIQSCTHSLTRLGVDYLDFYLLHWRGNVDLRYFLDDIDTLKNKQYIKDYGVSNFDINDIQELYELDKTKSCRINQVLYHIGSRGIEYKLIELCEQMGITIMAYSPLAQAGQLSRAAWQSKVLKQIADKHKTNVSSIMLAFVLRSNQMIAIPKSSNIDHINQNAKALEILLDKQDLLDIDKEFFPPNRKLPLDFE